MKEQLKIVCAKFLVASIIIVSVFIVSPEQVKASTISFEKVGGWYETIYAELSGVRDAQVTGVSYRGPVNGSLSGDDLEYLVRDTENGVRIDIPGLKAGNYTLSVITNSGTITKSNITVSEYDRSGYAHYNYTSGVGAYNDDGTLKDNAIVLYITDENKDIVSVTSKDGTTVTGIGHILNSSGRDSGNGLTPKGGIPNNNNGIMRRLADDKTPLVVRIIGTVSTPDGVTKKASLDYGGFLKDNGCMAAIQSGKDVTIEGIGTDSTIDGWGVHFMCQSDYPEYGKSFEVRNLSFINVPEDCVGMDGVQSGTSLKCPVERIWIHHCAFHVPTVENPTEKDKAHGDGACDFKKGQYFTNSYCFYDGYNKTNLLGGNDDNVQYNLTYHHNYWKNCAQRMPLARHANIHMYDNYFYGATSYCMEVRMDAYIFAEYNIFEKCNNPASIRAGVIKSFNNNFQDCSGSNAATIVTDKSKAVSSDNKYANFDTDGSLSYIPAQNYRLETTLTGKEIVALTGPMSDNTTISAGTGGTTGLVTEADGKTYYYVDGVVNTKYEGVVYSESDDSFWMVENGVVVSDYEGLGYSSYDGNFWVIEAGRVNFSFAGVIYSKYDDNFWVVEAGKVNFGYNGVVYSQYDGNFYMSENGKINFGYNGLGYSPYDGNFYVVESGKVNFNNNGIMYSVYDGNNWLVQDGRVQFGYTGNYTVGEATYNIVNGKVQ